MTGSGAGEREESKKGRKKLDEKYLKTNLSLKINSRFSP